MTPALDAPGGLRRWLLAVTVFALAARLAFIDAQPLTPDDRFVGVTARNFVEQGWPHPTMWNHPRLRDLLVAGSTSLFGEGALGLKVWSILLGTLAVPATAWLVVSLGGGGVAAIVAATVVALDPLHVDFSRQAINDVYLSVFPVAAIAALGRWRSSRAPGWLAFAGLLLGLGLASKWSVAFPVTAAAALWGAIPLARSPPSPSRTADAALILAALVLLPAAVYVATFWPLFERGHGLVDLFEFHRLMALETATHTGYPGTKHPGYVGEVAQAWRWFIQPIWFVDYLPRGADHGAIGYLVGVANPLSWLAVAPAFAWAGFLATRGRDPAALAAVVLFLAAYLPFLLVPRPIFTNSALAILPFAASLLGLAAERLWTVRRAPVLCWLALTAVMAAALWLPATGRDTAPTARLVRLLVPGEAFLPPAGAHLTPERQERQ